MRTNRFSSLWTFFLAAIAWFLVATLGWMQVSAWTSYPSAAIAHILLGNGAKDWVRTIHKTPGQLQVETRVEVSLPENAQGQGKADLVVEADPARYAYGLPLFLALLLASRSRNFIRRALAGYFILLIPQTFSLVFDVLKQILVAAGHPESLGIASWQMEAIALGYQFGSLLLPTLAPIALWFWLDRAFFAAVIVEGWLRRTEAK